MGGASQQSGSLEQVGTAADTSVNGQPTYYAWYELVPAAETKLDLAIHPGDQMAGSVTVNGTNVTISLSDKTTGQSVTKTLTMSNPDTSSAEWIAEAPSAQSPSGDVQALPLANFGQVTFTNTSATAGGHTGSISDPNWTVQQVSLQPSGATGALAGGGRFNPAGLEGVSQLSSAGASILADPADENGLSDRGRAFIAGQLVHARAMCSVLAPTVNSTDAGLVGPAHTSAGAPAMRGTAKMAVTMYRPGFGNETWPVQKEAGRPR